MTFFHDMLLRTSRTFALNIPLLPPELVDVVAVSYLVCRVADTVEDESDLSAEVRAELLRELADLVALPEDWRERAARFGVHTSGLLAGDTDADHVRLVAGLPLLLAELAGQARPVRELVHTCVNEMAVGMAEALLHREGCADVSELLGYCDIVAGTVGTLLTGLFAWHSGAVAARLPILDARALAFGRTLQLTNILKDVCADLDAGRCWLPRSVLREFGISDPEQLREKTSATRARGVLNQLLAVTHRELLEALAYLDALPAREVAIRRFCTAPLLLAVLTLRELAEHPEVFGAGPVKISRNAVRGALLTTRVLAGRPGALSAMFAVLRQRLPAPLPVEPEQPRLLVSPQQTVTQTVTAAADRLVALQSPSGSWRMDFGGVPFFLGAYVLACQVVGEPPEETTAARMVLNLRTHQNPDGGWGLDYDSPSTVLSSVLCYVALRVLGVPADDPCAQHAREFFLPHGGALGMPQWGKLLLAVLGVFDWKGICPFVPEAWLLPYRLPFHPGRLWAFPRIVYLSMSWLYGHRAVAAEDPLVRELRHELYPVRYEEVDWGAARARVASTDAFQPWTRSLKAVFAVLRLYERRPSRALRGQAMAKVLDVLERDNRSTGFLSDGPIPKVFDTLVWHFARPGGEEITAHVKRMSDHLWDAEDGTKVQCFDSAETWETGFAVQALVRSGHPGAQPALRAAGQYLAEAQRLADMPEAELHYRHPGGGGWPLSSPVQGRSISDGTAEALKACFALDELGLAEEVTPERRRQAVTYLLSLQNPDGGWATYDGLRGPMWLQKFNFSDTFPNLTVDMSTVEPTASCVAALRAHRERHPEDADPNLSEVLARAEAYMLKTQRPDGSWYGNWAVCFTYGTWFGVKGLSGSRDPKAAAAVDRACEFLLAHQRADGGWGETVHGTRAKRYVHAGRGQATQTAWALLTLVEAGRADAPAVQRGTEFLLRTQLPDGAWPEDYLTGACLASTGMNYGGYRWTFPLWALASIQHARRVGPS